MFPEVQGTWTARGLEHDLAAEGRTVELAVDTLMKIVKAHIAYDRRHRRKPLSAFPCAPQVYWNAMARATQLPILVELDWLDGGPPAPVIAAIVPQHPAVRTLPLMARTA